MNLVPEMLFQFLLIRETRRDMLLTDKHPLTVLEKAGYQIRITYHCWVEFNLFDSFEEFRSFLGFIENSHFFRRLWLFGQGFALAPSFLWDKHFRSFVLELPGWKLPSDWMKFLGRIDLIKCRRNLCRSM